MKANVKVNITFGGSIKVNGTKTYVAKDSTKENLTVYTNEDRVIDKTINFDGLTMNVDIQEDLDITTKEYFELVKETCVGVAGALKGMFCQSAVATAPQEETKKENNKE